MTIQNDISLKSYNTFGLDVCARQFVSITSESELQRLFEDHPHDKRLILGGGSNMLLTRDFDGLVIHINIKGIDIVERSDDHVILEAMAGENWHDLVMFCIEHDLGGIENLSLIPGNVGTAPIQNIGAYGVELKDVFVSCRAYHISSGRFDEFSNQDCLFGYRNSVFKNELKGKYIITAVRLRLSTIDHQVNTSYGAIDQALVSAEISNPGIREVSEAVIQIRQSKLPDPKKIGNSGSFFKNPVISAEHFDKLKGNFDEIPHYAVSGTEVKIPAGWLIEKAGFKGKRFDGYGVHDKQALVLVNHGNAKGTDILNLARLIQLTIKRIFDINLEAEVNIID